MSELTQHIKMHLKLGVYADYAFDVKNNFAAAGNGVTDDTVAIQAAITAAEAAGFGTVVVPDGTYIITDSLQINDSVRIILSPGAEIKQVTGIGLAKTMLKTKAVDATPVTITSMTSSANTATVTSTGHGYSVGDYILIHSSDSDGYNGVFEVKTVPTADTLTVRLPYTPVDATALGTIIMLPAVGHVILEGGTWNYDNPNNTANDGNVHSIVLWGVHAAEVKNLKSLHAQKFGLYLAGIQNLITDNITFDTESDGFHFLGPIYSADIRRTYGRSADNMFAVTTSEAAWATQLASKGSINSMVVDGIFAEFSKFGTFKLFGEHSGTSLTVTGLTKSVNSPTVTTSTDHGLKPGDIVKFDTVSAGMTEVSGRVFVVGPVLASTTFQLNDVDTSNYTTWSGTATAQKVSHYRIKNLSIKNARYMQVDEGLEQAFVIALTATQGLNAVIIDNLILDNIYSDEAMNGKILELNCANEGAMYIGNITFKSINIQLPTGGTAGQYAVINMSKNASDAMGQLVGSISFIDSDIKGYGRNENHRCIYQTGKGQILRLRAQNTNLSRLHSFVHFNGSGIPDDGYFVQFDNVTLNNSLQAVSSSVSPVEIHANNMKNIGSNYGIIRTNITTITHTIYGNNVDWATIDPCDTVSGTGQIRALGLGLRTKAVNLTPQNGDYVWDTDDSRPETWNGSAWVAM